MTPDYLIKTTTVILSLTTIMIAAMLFITITLPSRIESQIKEKVEVAIKTYDDSFNLRASLIDLIVEALLQEVNPKADKDVKSQIYAIKHVIRLLQGSEVDKIASLRALQGLGRDAAYLIPQIETIRRTQTWKDDVQREYNQVIIRLRANHNKAEM